MPISAMKNGVRRWRAVIYVDSKPVATKWFGPMESKEERQKALVWEEKTKMERELQQAKKAAAQELGLTHLVCTVSQWLNAYLEHAYAALEKNSIAEYSRGLKRFTAAFPDPAMPVLEITPDLADEFLEKVFRKNGGGPANRTRKGLSAAWSYGRRYLRRSLGFPNIANPWQLASTWPENHLAKKIPHESDFWQVVQLAQDEGNVQDATMLLGYLFTGARRAELFKLMWDDVDFRRERIRLVTAKTRSGRIKENWLPMVPELRQSLRSWWELHPTKRGNVFIVQGEDRYVGDAYKNRNTWLERLCKRAKVPRFTIRELRRLSASLLYREIGSKAVVQELLRHENASTTDRYIQSLGSESIRDSLALAFGNLAKGKVIPLPSTKQKTPDVSASRV